MRDHRQRNLQRLYGISPERFAEMLLDQNGVCAICSQPETRILHGKVCSLSVDHDHVTGEIRGLLCNRCNTTLGMVEKVGMNNFVNYLEEG